MRSIRTLIPLFTFQFLILLSSESQTAQKLVRPAFAEEFGRVVAIDGDTAIIGAPNTGPELGYAYIFEQQNSSWVKTQELQAPGSSINFGASVDISGDVAVVGDPDGGDDGQGQVFIFHRDNNWQLKESLSMPNLLLDYGEKFGMDVAVHGKTVVVTLAHTPPPGPGGSGTLRYIAQVYIRDDNFNYSDKALSLNGDGHVTIPYSSSQDVSDQITIEARIRISVYQDYAPVITKGNFSGYTSISPFSLVMEPT